MQTHQTQAQPQSQSQPHSPPTLEQFILDHEQRLQALAISSDEVVNHLNQLTRLRKQQQSEHRREISDLKSQIADLKKQVSVPQSWVALSLAGVVGFALLSVASNVVQNYHLSQMEARIDATRSIQTPKAHKN